jgi:16S rRNA (guanine966-N2)-methyltransferase
MRIVAGTHKGKRLLGLSKNNDNIRPTSDMAREALFSILARWPKGPFLDIFSGTGAVAIEAASRGYSPVWCIEHDKNAIECIQANSKGIDVIDLNIVPTDARSIKIGAFSGLSVIFADPPYDKSLEMWWLLAERLGSFLASDGILVWECHKKLDLPEMPSLTKVDERAYGTAKFVFVNSR